MKRTLMLTSPLMRGKDVAYARRLLASAGYLYDALPFDPNARWDDEAATAARQAKWDLGYAEKNCRGTFGTDLEKFLRGLAEPSLLMKRRAKKRQQDIGKRALREALLWVGTKENPAGSNIAKPFTEWYGWKGWGAPWCAVFVSYCLQKAGFNHIDPKNARWAYCPYFLADAKAGRHGLRIVRFSEVRPGDVVLFDWADDGVADHIGFVARKIDSDSYETVEGNTSFSDNSNGGEVMIRTRNTWDAIGFVRVA